MPKQDKDKELRDLVPEGAPSSVTEIIPRGQKLPKDLQKLVDKDDSFFDDLYDGQYELHLHA